MVSVMDVQMNSTLTSLTVSGNELSRWCGLAIAQCLEVRLPCLRPCVFICVYAACVRVYVFHAHSHLMW